MERSQEWLDRHALRFALAELGEEDESRFRELCADDATWSGLLVDDDARGHVPAALLARWSAAGRELRGVERRLVLEHVRSCDQCAEDLRVIGYAVDEWLAPVAPPGRGPGWLPWLGGTLLGAAAAVVLMLSVPSSEERGLHGGELPVVTPRAVRGDGGAVLQLDADARAILLATGLPVDLPEGVRPRLLVFAPDGSVLSDTLLRPTPWSPPSTQLALVGDPGFAPGSYRVELVVPGESGPRSLGSFRIEPTR